MDKHIPYSHYTEFLINSRSELTNPVKISLFFDPLSIHFSNVYFGINNVLYMLAKLILEITSMELE